jgi:O-antigen/teichoic acid export membrane protein
MFEEIKSLARHFMVYGLANIANRIVGFLLIPVYTHYLATSEYGTLELLELTTYVIGIGLAMGIGDSVLRFFYDSDDLEEKKVVVSTGFFSIWALCLVGGGLLVLLSGQVSLLVFESGDYAGMFRVVFIGLVLNMANGIPLAFMRAQQKSFLFSAVSFVRLALTLGLNILFIIGFGWGIWGILISTVINQALAAVYLGIYTVRWCGFHFSPGKLRQLMVYGLPFIPQSFGLFIINFADRFFLQRFTDLSEVGIYSLGYKFGMVINPLVTSPYEAIFRPKMFELIGRDDAPKINAVTFTYFMFLEIFVCLGIAVVIKDALHFISAPEYHSAYMVVPVILLSYVFNGAYVHIQAGLLITKKTKHIAYIVAAAAVVSLGLNMLLVPMIGIWGSASATLASFGLMFTLCLVVTRRIYPVKYQFGRVAKLLVVAAILYLLSLSFEIEPPLLSLAVKALLVLAYPVVLFGLGFYSREELDKLKEIGKGAVNHMKRPFFG